MLYPEIDNTKVLTSELGTLNGLALDYDAADIQENVSLFVI